MKKISEMFHSEEEMSNKFEAFIKDTFGNAYLKEHAGLFGRPDFVIYSKNKNATSIISLELKLRNWKRALKQAFRYKSFSNSSYVVMEFSHVSNAINNLSLFKQYNIGLASFDRDNDFQIFFKPSNEFPFSENLSEKMINSISASRKKAKNIEVLIEEKNLAF